MTLPMTKTTLDRAQIKFLSPGGIYPSAVRVALSNARQVPELHGLLAISDVGFIFVSKTKK